MINARGEAWFTMTLKEVKGGGATGGGELDYFLLLNNYFLNCK